MTFRLPLQISSKFIFQKSLSPDRLLSNQIFQTAKGNLKSLLSTQNGHPKHYTTGKTVPKLDSLLINTRQNTRQLSPNTQSTRAKVKTSFPTHPKVNYTSLLQAKAQFVSRRFYCDQNQCIKPEKKKKVKPSCGSGKSDKNDKKDSKIVCDLKPKKICPEMKVAPCKPRYRPDCTEQVIIPQCIKTVAPYESYGDCVEDGYIKDCTECECADPEDRQTQPAYQKTIPILLMKIDPPLAGQVDPAIERQCIKERGEPEPALPPTKLKPFVNPCRVFKMKGCKARARTSCDRDHTTPPCKKIEAPYESFSDCCPQFPEIEHTECDEQDKNVERLRGLAFVEYKKSKAKGPCAKSKEEDLSAKPKKSGGKSGGGGGASPCAMASNVAVKKSATSDSSEMKGKGDKKPGPCAPKKASPSAPGKKATPSAPGKKATLRALGKKATPSAPEKKATPCAPEKKATPCAPEKKATPSAPEKKATPSAPGSKAIPWPKPCDTPCVRPKEPATSVKAKSASAVAKKVSAPQVKKDPCKAKETKSACSTSKSLKKKESTCSTSKSLKKKESTCSTSKSLKKKESTCSTSKSLKKKESTCSTSLKKQQSKSSLGKIELGGKIHCVCKPLTPPKLASKPDASPKKEKKEPPSKKPSKTSNTSCTKLEAGLKKTVCSKSSKCKLASKKDACPKKEKKEPPCKKASTSPCTIPKAAAPKKAECPQKADQCKQASSKVDCSKKKPVEKKSSASLKSESKCNPGAKLSLWDRIVKYFKARPGCPAPDDYKKKDLIKKASQMGLKLCPHCPPRPDCPPAPPKPTCSPKKTKICKPPRAQPCKVPPQPCSVRKFSTCTNALTYTSLIDKSDKQGCEKALDKYSTQTPHTYYSKTLTDKYIGKIYQLRLGKIGIRNALVEDDTEVPPHTVCYICKFISKNYLSTLNQDNNINLEVKKSQESNQSSS